jgi:hypothetical protein
MRKKLKFLKEISFNTFNFVILLPVYFLGVGISKLLWYFAHLKGKKEKGWKPSKSLNNNIKDYEEMY